MIKIIKQPNAWTCVPAVCCMITGESLETFFVAAGHDGSAHDIASKHPKKVASFYMSEAFQYLAHYGFFPWIGFEGSKSTITNRGEITITFDPEDPNIQYILSVASQRFKGLEHVVLFSGGVIYDPNPLVQGHPDMDSYDIKIIMPIVNLLKMEETERRKT